MMSPNSMEPYVPGTVDEIPAKESPLSKDIRRKYDLSRIHVPTHQPPPIFPFWYFGSVTCHQSPPRPYSCGQQAKRFLDQNTKQALAEFHQSSATLPASHGPAESRVLSRISGRSSRCSTEALLRPTLFPAHRQTSGVFSSKGRPHPGKAPGLT
ncbi:hypothetical protein MG293_013672 [Ovis ammon polii]|uniref:Uncharacterized protein n=1 Tax=Ovis ammon polii TaxID=230172 RepID=A0AAD4U253_OVIAM|nr:hypothetical protein MG293_013672 [Ovis ammon polii]